MEKINFDDFLARLKTEKEELEVKIIKCIAQHKSGMHHTNAHEIIEGLIEGGDRDVIQGKLTTISHEREYIYLDEEIYKFNNKKYDITNIPHIPEKPIESYGVAIGAGARKSKKEMMEHSTSCVYLFMANTSPSFFKDLINYRVAKQYKTVVFFPHEECFVRSEQVAHKKNFAEWKHYLQEEDVKNYLDFYLVKNKKFKYLYSSSLTRDIVRFNYYMYRDNAEIHTGYGIIHVGEAGTSFYGMIKQEYERAFYERIPVSVAKWNNNSIKKILGRVCSCFRRHLVKMIMFALACGAIAAYIILAVLGSESASIVSSIFVLFTMVIGFLQHRINNILAKGQLRFTENE